MAAGPTARTPSSIFQSLEARQLLATVSVANFGAIVNDGKDDSSAIQRAVNAADPGDTILFSAGTYNIDKAIDPRGEGRILRGQNTTLEAGDDNFSMYFRGKDVTITGFTFKGRGIFMDKPRNQMVEGVVIDNNRFQLEIAQGSKRNSIEFTTGLRNTKITNNRFDPVKGDNGIYGYNWDNLVIANNEFVGGNEGIHIIDHTSGVSRNLLIEQNYFSGLKRMGIEIQGGGDRTIVQDNWYENPVLGPTSKSNADTFAYSIIADRSTFALVRRNVAIMPTSKDSPDGIGVKIIYELGGKNLVAEDNYSLGGNHVVAANGARATGIVRNNRLVSYRQGPSNANGSQVKFENNGPNVQLTWDMKRGRPGVNKRYGTASAPPVTTSPPQTTPPPEVIPPEDTPPVIDEPEVQQPEPTPTPPVIPTTPVPQPAEPPESLPSVPPTPPLQPPAPVVPTAPTKPVATPPDIRTPSSLQARIVSPTRVDLFWLDTSRAELGFKIERTTDGKTWTEIAIVGKNLRSFADFSVVAGNIYSYRIRAFAEAGDSAYSNTATVAPNPPPPPVSTPILQQSLPYVPVRYYPYRPAPMGGIVLR